MFRLLLNRESAIYRLTNLTLVKIELNLSYQDKYFFIYGEYGFTVFCVVKYFESYFYDGSILTFEFSFIKSCFCPRTLFLF